MQSYSRQRRNQLGLDLRENRIYERSLRFYRNQKDQGKKHPALDHQWNHPRSAEKGGCSLKAAEISYGPPTTEVSRTSCKAKTLIRENREIYFSSLDSDLAREVKRFWSFFKLKNKTRTFPETMNSGDDNQQGPQASTPRQIAALFNCYFVLVFTAHSEVRTLSAPFTPSHPTLNELEIPVLTNGFDISEKPWYKQSNWIRWNSSAPAEGNCWPDRTVPDHVIQQILATRHFCGRLETREYCTRSGGSTGSYNPPHQSRTTWLFSQ